MTAMTATRTAHAPAPTGHTPAPDAGTQRLTLAKAITLGLGAALRSDPSVLLMGEDIGRLGGVFRVTDGLQKEFGHPEDAAEPTDVLAHEQDARVGPERGTEAEGDRLGEREALRPGVGRGGVPVAAGACIIVAVIAVIVRLHLARDRSLECLLVLGEPAAVGLDPACGVA